jgi:hypothetical protein
MTDVGHQPTCYPLRKCGCPPHPRRPLQHTDSDGQRVETGLSAVSPPLFADSTGLWSRQHDEASVGVELPPLPQAATAVPVSTAVST